MTFLAFAALGFLIGNLVGLTSESVVSALMPLLFAFGGGTAVGFIPKLDAKARTAASVAITALSLMCLAGTYVGIAVSEYQLLTPPERRQARAEASVADLKYVRSFLVKSADEIDQQRAIGQLTTQQAYEALYKLVSAKE
jgi:hypothetical protein